MNQTVQLIISNTIFMHCACVLCVSPRSRPLSFNQETRVSSTLGTILISRQQKGGGLGGANADVCLHGERAFKKYDVDVISRWVWRSVNIISWMGGLGRKKCQQYADVI